MQPKRLFISGLLASTLYPLAASALVVEIQGKRLEPEMVGASCVDIAGEYPGIRIEPSEAGATPRICYTSSKGNAIAIVKAIFIATNPVKQDVTIRFEHDFPAGINGKVMARAKLQGFFSTASGVGVPTGNKISMRARFSQAGKEDDIGEPFALTVDDQIDSALFEYNAKEQYLIAGPRALKGELKLNFREAGGKLTLPEKSAISIDTGSTFEDKLDTLALPQDDEETPPTETAPPAPATPEGTPAVDPSAPALPDTPIPLPTQSIPPAPPEP
jgi:hypothetical protein